MFSAAGGLRMDWLWGIIIGFALGLVGGRVQSRWDRHSRSTETVESLSSEISLNKQKVERAMSELTASQRYRLESYLAVPFLRDAFNARIGDLGLLPKGTREAVLSFYARLQDLELVIYEGYLRQTIFPLDQLELRALEKDDQESWEWFHDRKRTLHDMFEHRAKRAMEAGDGALVELRKLAAQPWWRRIVGR
jgi:hypothetical protein